LLLIAALALAIFYKTKGALGGHGVETGKKIERFTPFERAAHWTNAGAFVALGLSGIVMAFGKFFILPVIGGTLFGWLTYLLKNLHNFVGPLFAVSLLIVIVTFVKDNIANAADWIWLKRAGGMLGDHEVPSHRFNAGEKGMFWWGVCFPGLVVVASGLVLDKLIPGLGDLRGEMQVAHMIHAVAAVLMLTMLIGHIYMGTIGVKGAYGAMKTGYVDEGWAKEHHELWYNDIKAGKIPAQRSVPAAPSSSASGVTASV
jgi:formate dehydrogenase subunit gamma